MVDSLVSHSLVPFCFQYFVLLFLLMCIELGIAVITLIYKERFLTGLEERLTGEVVHHYGHKNSNEKYFSFSESVDFAQYKVCRYSTKRRIPQRLLFDMACYLQFNCCGIRGDGDYFLSRWRNESIVSVEPRNVPLTCCVLLEPGGVGYITCRICFAFA